MYVQCKIRLSFGLLSWNLEYSFKVGLDLHLGTSIHKVLLLCSSIGS